MIGLIAGFAVLFFELAWYVSRFFVPPPEYVYQSSGLVLSTLGTGGLATLSSLAAIMALGLMVAKARLRASALVLLASALGMVLVYPIMTVGFSGTFFTFLLFPILPAVLLIGAALCALIATRTGEPQNPVDAEANTGN